MYDRFVKYLYDSGMADLLREHGAVLAAYSGGADSTLLLHFLDRYCRTEHIALYAAQVHHGIRGEEADRDEQHCRNIAEELHIPLYIQHVDIPTLAEERSMGLEECARAERYAWFDAVCRSLEKPDMPVATAHNADDQLETVLFHMLRGSGLSGMTGIAPVRGERYLRPLLSFGSAEIREACREYGYLFVEDSTNTDTAYTRNYIRHEILPRLRHLTPHPEEAVNRMTALLARDHACLEAEAAAWLEKAHTGNREEHVTRDILRKVHPALGSRMLRIAYGKCVSGCSMTGEQTEQLLQLAVKEDKQIRRMSLPGGVTAEVRGDAVYFDTGKQQEKRGQAEEKRKFRETAVPSIAPGETVILDWGTHKIVLSRKNSPTRPENLENIYNLSIQRPINFAKIKGVLCLRTRRPGDTIRYRNLSRKIRKLQNEFRIPPEKRETMLILADEEEVLWVEGWDVCDKVRFTGKAEDVLWIELYCPASGNRPETF